MDPLKVEIPKSKSLISKLYAYCEGKCSSFFLFYAIAGITLQWLHRLDQTYIAFMVAHLGFVLGHSAKQDYFERP
jgi:hypothetical protein